MRILAAIEDPAVARKILDSLGEGAQEPVHTLFVLPQVLRPQAKGPAVA